MALNLRRGNLNNQRVEAETSSAQVGHRSQNATTQDKTLPHTLSAPALLTTALSQDLGSPKATPKSRWLDAFERVRPKQNGNSKQLAPSTPLTRKFFKVAQNTTAARELIGTADSQFTPGVREYLFPKPIAPLKGRGMAGQLLTGKRGLTTGLEEVFVEERVGRGFGKILSSVVFLPFTLIAMAVDAPRFLGAHLIEKSNQVVMKGVVRGDRRGSLLIMAGGLGRILGGLCKLSIPLLAVFLGLFAGGIPGIVAAVLFETVYFGEDLTSLLKGDFEEMTLFKGLSDIIGGFSVIFGAEFIWRLRRGSRTSEAP